MYHIPIHVNYQGMLLKGYANPVASFEDNAPPSLRIYIQGWCLGTLSRENKKWKMDNPIDPTFIEILGKYIYTYTHSRQSRRWRCKNISS